MPHQPPHPLLFNAPCKSGQLQVDESAVRVVAPFGRIIWSVPRAAIARIGVKKGAIMVDLTLYTVQGAYPASTLTKQNAEKFLAHFPSIETGAPLPAASLPVFPPSVPRSQPLPSHLPPQLGQRSSGPPPSPPKKKPQPPAWAYVVTGVLFLALCGCIGWGVISMVQAMNVPLGTPTPSIAAQVTQDPTIVSTPARTPTARPTAKPTPKPTPRPTPKPTQPPAPSLAITFTCASAVDYSYGQVCVHTEQGAALTITVTYCSGYDATSDSLQGTVYANSVGNYEWTWEPETKCRGAATATVNATWNGQSVSNTDTFTVQ